MKASIAAAILVMVFAAGVAAGYYLKPGLFGVNENGQHGDIEVNTGTSNQSVIVEANLTSKPRIAFDNTSWTFEISITLKPRDLGHPLEVSGVDVYVRVETGKGGVWVRAEKNVIGGFSYDYVGDMLLVPDEESHISVEVETPRSFKPVDVVIVVHLKGYGDVYSNIINLRG